jgi:hypothetical protein
VPDYDKYKPNEQQLKNFRGNSAHSLKECIQIESPGQFDNLDSPKDSRNPGMVRNYP